MTGPGPSIIQPVVGVSGQDALLDDPLSGPAGDSQNNPDPAETGLTIGMQPEAKKGPLLDLPPDKAGKLALRMWRSQEPLMRRLRAEWRANYLRRRGYSNIAVIRETDGSWTCWAPPLATPPVPALNKAARLCRRLVGVMFADPWVPEVSPDKGTDDSRDAAEFSGRALTDIQSETNCRTITNARRAFDLASVYHSGFVYTCVDPTGGGKQPIQIMACPEAQSVQDALQYPSQPQLRYANAAGMLVPTEAEAARQWQPSLREHVLTGRQVRLFPWTAKDVWEADGCQIGLYMTWGDARDTFPELAKMDEATVRRLLDLKPQDTSDSQSRAWDGDPDPRQTDWKDSKPIFVLLTYWVAGPTYPDGAYTVTVGDGITAHRQSWTAQIEGRLIPMILPLTQYKQWEEGAEDPYGVGAMSLVGAGNEIRATQIMALIDYLDKFNNRKIFLPTNSIIQPKQYQLMTHTVIPVNPGGEPKYEDIPPYPRDAIELYTVLGDEMDGSIGLEQAAQGVEDPSVQSGRHAMQIVAQVHAGLSDVAGRCELAYQRQCRIQLQLMAAYFDRPRRLKFVGPDGQYKERHWSGSDLVTDTDIRTKPGTGTMLTPAAKAELAERYAGLGIIQPPDLRDMISQSLGGTLGIEDDPVRTRIRQQLGRWEVGPPPGWQPPVPVGMDPATGQPIMAPDPALASIFEPTPSDMLPDVAAARLWEMRRFMQSGKYLRWPPPWRTGLDTEFQRMYMSSQGMQQPQPQQGAAPAPAQSAPPSPDAQLAAEATGNAPPTPVPPAQ